jgi:histidine triad (HIT) family protein
MACVFCEIVAGRLPARKAYEDDALLAFHDVNPQAPTHLLVIPKRHVGSLLEAGPAEDGLIGCMARKARELAQQLGHGERGFRIVMNCGPDSGYSVFHVHLHLLGGRVLGWPPG